MVWSIRPGKSDQVHFGQRFPQSGWLLKLHAVLFFCTGDLRTLNPKHQMLVVVTWESSKGALVFLKWCPGNWGVTGQRLRFNWYSTCIVCRQVLGLCSSTT